MNNKALLLSVLVCTGMLLPALVTANPLSAPPEEEEAIVTDRPDFTESSETVPLHRTQLEVGYTSALTANTRLHTVGEVLIRVGVTPKTELRFTLNSFAILNTPGGSTTGFQDLSIGAKWRLTEAQKGYGLFKHPQSALITSFSLPSGSSSFREHTAQTLFKLCLGWELTPKWGMGVNFNYSYVSQAGDRYNQFATSLTLGYSWSKRISTFYEIYGFVPGGFQAGNNTYADTGIAYLVNKDTQFDARVGFGMNGISRDYFIGAGFSRRF
ncbi:MAG: transporter [Armatimonadetes bacterium]|nr:transporter [Armatimonadota bacterium]